MLSKLWDWVTYPFKIKSASDFESILRSYFAGVSTSSGESVNPLTAMQCAAVYACVNVISESVAMLPLCLYRRKPGSVDRAQDHPLYNILHNQPNHWQTSFDWRQMCQAHLLLRGNAYSYIVRAGSRGRETVRELIPVHPDNMFVWMDNEYVLHYTISTRAGVIECLQKDVLHLRGMSLNGWLGVSPISYVRESIGLALATEKHGARIFGNGARPSGVLTTPNVMKDEVIKALREQWQLVHGGENSGSIAVLHGGLDFKPIAMSANDSQFLETRKYQRSEIASLFRVPAHFINDLERATFSNIEHLGIEFVVHALQPWFVRWEQAISRDLLRPDERDEYYAEFLMQGLMRGDMKSRYDAYAVGVNGGWLSPNDCRSMENLNPREGGDTYLTPMNMVPSGTSKEPSNASTPA